MRFILLVLGVALFLPSALAPPVLAQPRGGSRVVLFEDVDFRGEQRMVDREVRDLRDIGFNDRASSIRVESGTWEFCEDADFRGRCVTLSRDERNLVPEGFNDRISSARPVADRNQPGGSRGDNRGNDRGRGGDVTLYADINFGGASRDAGESRDLRNLDFNDTVSSIRIRSGTWQFCEDADFKGRCITADRDVPSLVPSGFNDKISSMRKVR
jgi:hypothetical protein